MKNILTFKLFETIDNLYQGAKTVVKNSDQLNKLEVTGKYIIQPKLDGIWVTVVTDSKGRISQMVSRHGKVKTEKGFDYFVDYDLGIPNTILIGEMVRSETRLYIFDIYQLKGKEVHHLDYEYRRTILEDLPIYKDRVDLVPQFKDNFLERYKSIIKNGGEGVIIKKYGSGTQYIANSRNPDWMKLKPKITMDYVIIGYEESQAKSHANLIKAVRLGLYKNGKLTDVGAVGNMTREMRKYITDNKTKLLNTVIEIGANEVFKTGAARHPYIERLRPDLKPKDASFDKVHIMENFTYKKSKTVLEYLKELLKPVVSEMEEVGSLSRYHKTVNDIDIVAVPKKNVNVVEHLLKNNIKIKSGKDMTLFFDYKGVPVNLWLTPKESFGATVLHFAAGKGIIQMKIHAKKQGYMLNTYGLFDKDGNKIAGEDYKEILRILETNTKYNKIQMLKKATENVSDADIERFSKEGQFPRLTTGFYRFRQFDPKLLDKYTMKQEKNDNAMVFGTLNGKWLIQSHMINVKNMTRAELTEYLEDILSTRSVRLKNLVIKNLKAATINN